MSLAQPPAPERQPSPGLALNLASKNPFRNGTTSSPTMASPTLPPSGGRPASRNPFLASFEQDSSVPVNGQQQSPRRQPTGEATTSEQRSNPILGDGDIELFDRLTLTNSNPNPNNRNMGPPPARTGPPNGVSVNRPRVSGEEMRRPLPPGVRQGPAPQRRPAGDGPKFPSGGERRPQPRPRRNSESSVAERPPMSEEDRRRRERRRREEYERRKRAERAEKGERDDSQSRPDKTKDKDTKDRDGKTSSSKRKPHGLDIIDKLDVTGIYGAGLFHHDGPFDACNPHRNRKRDQRAPMQAFPANSANMAMGGGGPVNKQFDVAKFHGYAEEGFKDYGTGYEGDGKLRPTGAARTLSFDPTARAEPVHGEESMGLGTSTFLEGAPASRKAIQRRESETDPPASGANGAPMLSRKKSLAQRIRGISAPRARAFGEGPLQSPEARYGGGLSSPGSPPADAKTAGNSKIPAVGGRRVQSAASNAPNYKSEQNPFDNLYDKAYEQKGASIRAAEKARAASSSGPSGGSQSFSRKIVPTQLEDRPMPEDDQTDVAKSSASRPTTTRIRALSSPRRGTGLERIDDEGRMSSTTEDSEDYRREVKSSSGGGGGLLTRMKSLKKSSRPTRPS